MSFSAHLHSEVEILNVRKYQSFLISVFYLHIPFLSPKLFKSSLPPPSRQVQQSILSAFRGDRLPSSSSTIHLSAFKDNIESRLTDQNPSLNLNDSEEVSTFVLTTISSSLRKPYKPCSQVRVRTTSLKSRLYSASKYRPL